MAELTVGDKAPDFTLCDKDGNAINLSSIEADFTVVYFYPKDDTPGCTLEAQGFSASLKDFKKLGTLVLGISGGDELSKQKFCSKYELEVTLLSDPDFSVAKKYGSYGEKNFMGKKSMGILRKTFVLNAEKQIIKIYDKVDTKTHSDDVLTFLREQRSVFKGATLNSRC